MKTTPKWTIQIKYHFYIKYDAAYILLLITINEQKLTGATNLNDESLTELTASNQFSFLFIILSQMLYARIYLVYISFTNMNPFLMCITWALRNEYKQTTYDGPFEVSQYWRPEIKDNNRHR